MVVAPVIRDAIMHAINSQKTYIRKESLDHAYSIYQLALRGVTHGSCRIDSINW